MDDTYSKEESARLELEELNNSDINYEMELFLNEIYSNQELATIIQQAKVETVNPGQIQTFGAKSVAAKVAVKGMIKTVKKIGKKQWNSIVSKAPAAIAKYIKYDAVLQVFNIVTGIEGTIENGLIIGFKSIGLNAYWAGVAARTVMTIAL